MPTDPEIFQPLTNLGGLEGEVIALRRENKMLLSHCEHHKRDYASIATKLDAAEADRDRLQQALRGLQGLSEQVDKADGPLAYNMTLVALALATRDVLRKLTPAALSPASQEQP